MPNQQKNYIKEEMDMVELHSALRHNIPQDWRIGQFLFNFLEWLEQKGYAPSTWSLRMADPFHLSDEDFIKYWFEYLKSLNKKEDYDPGPCYRCHQWPCCCKEGPLMNRN